MRTFFWTCTLTLFFLTCVSAQDFAQLQKTIEDNIPEKLPHYLGRNAPPQELVNACKVVVESANRIYALPNLDERNRRWALQREAFARIPLAYIDTPSHYARLTFLSDELEKLGAKNVARLTEEHVLRVGILLTTQQKSEAMNINVQALAERMVMFVEQHPGRESSELIDLFLQQVRLMGADDRDSRLAIIVPIFRDYFAKTQQAAKASALANTSGDQYIFYSQFGAVGDGVADDFAAIIAAHKAANKAGLSVKADAGATYYIGDSDKTAVIQTDTDWTGAKFIIDDRNVDANRQTWIFLVKPTLPMQWYDKQTFTLEPNQTNLGRALSHDSLILLLNNNVLTFDNSSLRELLIVDKDGTIHADTPVFNRFNQVTSMFVSPIDKVPLTIRGGHFTTINNQTPYINEWYAGIEYARGIRIERSNTTVDGITHDIIGEDHPGVLGNRYDGFISIYAAANVIVQNVIVHGRKIEGYELEHTRAVNVTYRNVTQSTDILDTTYWTVSTGNWVRNLVYDNVELNRVGNHRGMHDVTVRNSTVGRIGGSGSGILLVENTSVMSVKTYAFFQNVYSDPDGRQWVGEVVIRNCRYKPGTSYTSLSLVAVGKAYYPKVVVDGLHIISTNMASNRPKIRIYYEPTIPDPVVPDEIYVRGITYSDNWREGFDISGPTTNTIPASMRRTNIITEWSDPPPTGDIGYRPPNNSSFSDVKVIQEW